MTNDAPPDGAPDAGDRPQRIHAPHVLFWVLGLLWLAAAIALTSVRHPGQLQIASPNPSPHGYTWSLAFFALPVAALTGWLHWRPQPERSRRAFRWTLCLLIPLGFALDVLFGVLFFQFPCQKCTLGIYLPGLTWPSLTFAPVLPLEEFFFYGLGFCAILSAYLWFDNEFLARYRRGGHASHRGRLIRFDVRSLILAVALTLTAMVWKYWGPHDARAGFPGWMVFLVWVGMLPAVGLYRTARPFVNWRALTFTATLMTLVSVMWEATLAVPYGWWGYERSQMVGVFIGAWAGLPIEQPVLWVLISFTTVIVYHSVHVVLHKLDHRSLRRVVFSRNDDDDDP